MTDPTAIETPNTRAGFVSVIGLSNAGKSTLINNMVGAKVSIVSQKMQTTRTRVLGIAMHEQSQIVLIDTPGIFKPKKTLEKAMVGAALSSLEDADFIIHLVDATHKTPIDNNAMIFQSLKGQNNVILVLNKIDKIPAQKLLEISKTLNEAFAYKATFMISALNGKGVKDLARYLGEILPHSEYIFPEDQLSDMPMRLLAAEITREKIFEQLHQELPYAIFIDTEAWEDFDNGSLKISQVIVVERDSQKAIILGRGGSRIKAIGQAARLELEEIMEQKIHLKLFVKVQENWAEKTENYSLFGLDIRNNTVKF